MSDNTTLPGIGEVYASDDISGVKHQRIKVSVGEDGTANDLSQSLPMPASEETMAQVLKQLKIMNLHLSVMTDNHFNRNDV